MMTIKPDKLCRTFFAKGIGLMFLKKRTVVFEFKKEKIVPLHMLFVFYPIDVLFLNKEKKIVEIKKNFKPFSFYTPRNKAKYIVEMPKTKQKLKIGDTVTFI
ncbi:DUF192 domain-containing protein [Candidatus Woesearchaeota archaeon]|nr:DUF192 domain-containing protein [Candidatus Woesearchaeota archaeon]